MGRSISLRLKALAVIGGGLVVLLTVLLGVLSGVLTRNFGRLQANLADDQLERVVRQMDNSAQTLQANVADNAVWDETFNYIRGELPDYLSRNYYDDPDYEEDYNMVLVYDNDRRLLGGVTLLEDRFEVMPPEGVDTTAIGESDLVGTEEGDVALIDTEAGPMMVASWPVTTTDAESEIAGTLVYGLFLEQSVLPRVSKATNMPVVLAKTSEPGGNIQASDLSSNILGPVEARFQTPGSEWLEAQSVSAELTFSTQDAGRIDLAVEVPAQVFQEAVASRRAIFLTVLIGGVVLVALALALIELQVLHRLAAVNREFERLSREPDSQGRLVVRGADEFSGLAASANSLLDQLDRSQEKLAHERSLIAGVFDAISEAVFAVRPVRADSHGGATIVDFKVTRANQAAHILFQLKESEQRLLSDILKRESGSKLWRDLIDVAETGGVFSEEIRDGKRWLTISAQPWEDGLVISISDITARKESESRLRETLDEIEVFNAAMLGREERILELKQEVNDLSARLSLPQRYGVEDDVT